MENDGSNCYRIAVLQTLLHLPRFLHWLRDHRAAGQNWNCNPNDPNLRQPIDDNVLESLGPHATGCVPCLLKQLIKSYWGRDLLSEDGYGSPLPLCHDDEGIVGIHNLAERWFCRDPYGWSEKLDNELGKHVKASDGITFFTPVRPAKYKNYTEEKLKELRYKRSEPVRADHRFAQQDAEEFMRFILDGIKSSYNGAARTNLNNARKRQYDSLFTLTCHEYRTCNTCHERYFHNSLEWLGLRVTPLADGTDMLVAAIDRTMHDELNAGHSACALGCKDTSRIIEFRMHATPEYLSALLDLHLDMSDTKNKAKFLVPETLDLTKYMTTPPIDQTPVRYRLISGVYHSGNSLRAGHYTAGVTGLKASPRDRRPASGDGRRDDVQYWCNDSVVREWENPGAVRNKLTINPVDFSTKMNRQGAFQPYILWHVREPDEVVGRVSGKRLSVMVGDTVANRVKNAPRVRIQAVL